MSVIYPQGIEPDDATKARTEEFFEAVEDSGAILTDDYLAGLVKQGICLEARGNIGNTPLIDAAKYGRIKTVDALLAKGAKIDKRNHLRHTPLLMAAIYGKTETIQLLVAKGALLEEYNREGSTALILAVMNEHADAVKALLALGAKREARSNAGWTALHHATPGGFKKIIEILVAAGADIEAPDGLGITPLGTALRHSSEDSFHSLLALGANIEARDNTGCAPLLLGAMNGSTILRAALAKGANFYAQEKHGSSVINFSDMANDPFVIEGKKCYEDFIASHKAPASTEAAYQLLALTPLADPKAPVDYTGNLRRIFTHAAWENKEQAETILKDMQKDGTVSAATCESILAATFPPKRSRAQTRSVGVAI